MPAVKNSPANARDSRDLGSIPELGRSPVMAAHSSILAWKYPMDRSLAGYRPSGHKESNTTEPLNTHINIHTHK